MNGLFVVHFVEDRGECGGFAGARGAGDQHDAVAQGADFGELWREVQVVETGDAVRDDTHDDGTASALPENVDTETGNLVKAVGQIGGTFLFEFLRRVFIAAEKDFGDVFGIVWNQALETFELQLNELAADFDLGGAAGREDEIADMLA